MSPRTNDLSISPELEREPAPVNVDIESKFEATHNEVDGKYLTEEGKVADEDAKDYVNPDLVITPEENKRLRRRIDRRYVY